MDTLSAAIPPTRPNGSGLWKWLLHTVGLEAWFRQTPATAQVGSEERVFLRLALPGASGSNNNPTTALLSEVLSECLAAIRAGGGEVVIHQGSSVLLSWATEQGKREVVPVYFKFRELLRGRGHNQKLFGAASLGWVISSRRKSKPKYQGEVLSHVAGMLRENQQLNHDLLVSAALYHHLDQTFPYQYQLHVGFNLPGHRYPATLFRVTAETVSEPYQQSFAEEPTTTAGKVSALPCL